MKPIIFNLLQSNSKGGMENIFLEYSKILNKNDYKVVCLISKNFIFKKELEENKITTHILNIKGHFDIFASIKFYFLVNKYSTKIIMAHNGRNFSCINLCKKIFGLKKAKIIAVSHGGNVKRLLNFDYVIAVAKHIEKNIQINGFGGKVKTIYNGIKLSKNKKISKKENSVFTFGALSRLSNEKNIALLIESFASFNKKINKESELIIAGDGEERGSLENLAKRLNIKDKIKFIGWIGDKEEFFSRIDVLIQPSKKESFGISAIESFKHSTPVISSNAKGPKEIIQDNYNGFLFDINKKEDLFLKMEEVHQRKGDLEKITSQAYQDLVNKFSYKKMSEDLVAFLKNI
jgi:glycosyltransferase involved in cell wall biosynthesis